MYRYAAPGGNGPHATLWQVLLPGPLTRLVACCALSVDIVAAALAGLGARHVLRLSLIQTVAWAYVGVAAAVIVVLVIGTMIFTVLAEKG